MSTPSTYPHPLGLFYLFRDVWGTISCLSQMRSSCLHSPLCSLVQDVERECAAACASLAMPMPLNVSLRPEDLSQLQQHLLMLLQQPEQPVPFTPSLRVRLLPIRHIFLQIAKPEVYGHGAYTQKSAASSAKASAITMRSVCSP